MSQISKLSADNKEVNIDGVQDLEEKDFFYVDGLHNAGLTSTPRRTLLYLRHESDEHIKRLDAVKPGAGLIVDGPKGLGKSVITWTWARLKATSGSTVLWVHIDNFTKKAKVLEMDEKGVRELKFDGKPLSFGKLEKSELVDEAKHDIVILDGFHFAMHQHILTQLFDPSKNKKRIRILVSSMQSQIQEKDLEMSNVEEYRLASWKTEEFEEVIKNEIFYKQVEGKLGPGDTKEKKLNSKLYYSGLSSRFTFYFSIERVQREIKKGLGKLPSKKQALDGDYSQEHLNASNALYGGVRNADGEVKDIFVSRYTLDQMYIECPDNLSHAYKLAIALGNQSFLGWVVEADFLMSAKTNIKNQEPIKLYDSKGELKFKMEPNTYESFDETKGMEFKENVLYIPRKWNYPAFDFFYCYKVNRTLRQCVTAFNIILFGNVTVQHKSKECKLQHVEQSAKDLNVRRVRFAGISPLSERHDNKMVTWLPPPKGKNNINGFYYGDKRSRWNGNNHCETLFFKSKQYLGYEKTV